MQLPLAWFACILSVDASASPWSAASHSSGPYKIVARSGDDLVQVYDRIRALPSVFVDGKPGALAQWPNCNAWCVFSNRVGQGVRADALANECVVVRLDFAPGEIDDLVNGGKQ